MNVPDWLTALTLIVAGVVCIAQGVALYRTQQKLERLNAKHSAAKMVLRTVIDRLKHWHFGDTETCMCGEAIRSHNPLHSDHSPLSFADYSRDETIKYIDNTLKDLMQ